jgi:hypothetical protein
MSKLERKKQAQDALLQACGAAFYKVWDSHLGEPEKAAAEADLKAQFARIEKLFGYKPGSWGF